MSVRKISPKRIQSLLEKGVALHQAGQLAQARAAYGEILEAQPGHGDALHLSGLIALQSNLPREAVELIGRAVRRCPEAAVFHANLGVALLQLGRADEALACYDKAITLDPRYAEAYFNRGNAFGKMEKYEAALGDYGNAIAIRPSYVAAFLNRGNIFRQQGRLSEALADYERVIALAPGSAEAYSNRGIALQEQGQFIAAIASYKQAVALDPHNAQAYANLGFALKEVGQTDAALISCNMAIALAPEMATAYLNRGLLQHEAMQIEAALASYEEALARRPDYAAAHWNKALVLLLEGRFAQAWPLFEWRRKRDGLAHAPRDFAEPLWLGEFPLNDKVILLHSEQGLGDTIQFCRYVKKVAALGARVILEVPVPLLSLFRSLDGVDRLVAAGEPLPSFDYHCSLLSLPLAFRTELASVPAEEAYLKADPLKKRYWQERLAAEAAPPKLRVGLVWAGGFRPDQPELWGANVRRNIELAKLAGLKAERIAFYSLQKGEPAESDPQRLAQAAWDGPQIVDYSRELTDFSDTAALLDNLDLVISVDTSTAHLAAALGKPVWILNRFDTCWRWLLDREDSPWYPTVRLYRQQKTGDWDSVLERVKADLGRLAAAV